jgi:diguanylate cyclase (GGDEF)-like protein/PAS domain S-box-containing protein
MHASRRRRPQDPNRADATNPEVHSAEADTTVSRRPGRSKRFIVAATLAYVAFATTWILFSDQLLITLGDAQEIARLSTLKGIIFVLITAVALVAGLRAVALRAELDGRAVLPDTTAHTPWPLLLLIALLALTFAAIGMLVYRAGSAGLERQKLQELATVTELKVDTISRWLDERRSNVRAFSQNPAIAMAVDSWMVSGTPGARADLLGALAALRRSYHYAAVELVDVHGSVQLADGVATLGGPRLQDAVKRTLEGGNPALVDLYRVETRQPGGDAHGAESSGKPALRFGFVASVTVARRGAHLGRMLVAVELDPEDFLYPALHSWPTGARSAETALAERAGDSAVFLSDLRERPDAALSFEVPLTDTAPTVTSLVSQPAGTIRGIDYRGVAVLAAGRAVPGTPWTVLAKIDQAEADIPIRRLAALTIGVVAAAIAFILAIGLLLWQRQRLQGVLGDLQRRAEMAAAELRFHATFDQATIGLAHLDLDGRWLRVNRRLCILTGLDHAQLLASDPRTIAAPEGRSLEACLRALLSGAEAECSGERRFRRPDDTEVWLRLAASLVRGEDGAPRFVMLTVDDITTRKDAELALRERVNLHEYLEKIAKTVPGMIYSFQLAVDGGVSMPYVSPGLADIFYDITPAEAAVDAAAIMARIHPEDSARVWSTIATSAAELAIWSQEFRVCHPVRGLVWISCRAMPERDASGGTLWHGFLSDTTDRKRAEAELRQAAAVFTNTQEGVIITDLGGTILRVNPAVCTITGYTEPELIGQRISMLKSGRHDRAFYDSLWQVLRADGSWQGEIWNRRKNGEVYPELLTISTVRDDAGAITNYVGTFTDITRMKQSERQLERLAHHDALTGLPNRLLLLSRLEHAVERSRRHTAMGAVLFLDLDRFKNVNDSLGHPAGDELLIAVADRMRLRLRDTDTLARLGGDEFVVVLEDVGNAQRAAAVAQELIERLSAVFTLSSGHEVYIGASVGISMFPTDSMAANDLIQSADAALYAAKEAGKGTYRFYRTELTAAANTRLGLEARLRRGLERGEMVLHYQPLITIAETRPVGVEALLRWNDPSEGLIGPERFIALAEETGLIVPLGDWVLREACRQFQVWREQGLGLDTVAVNLSPRQFQLPDIGLRIGTILKETGLPPACLELEITESALMHHGEETLFKLAALKDLGIRLAIDDFGTGYSSLAYLKRFPIDKLKIDKSFVSDLPRDAADSEITAAIISLAKNLKLEVLAEGVETEAQLAFLKEHGCDTAQGFLFARPTPGGDLKPIVTQLAASPASPTRPAA